MSKKQEELNNLALDTFFNKGTLTGAAFLQATGMKKEEAQATLGSLMQQGLIGRDGEGPATVFGLSDAGLALFEQAPAEGQEFEVVEDEFSQAPPAQAPAPARRAPARQAPAPAAAQAPARPARAQAAQAPAQAPAARPTPRQAPARAAAPAAQTQAPARRAPAPAATPAPAAAKAQAGPAAPEAAAVQRPVKYGRIDYLSGADWSYRVDIGTEAAWRIVEEGGDLNAYLNEIGEEGQLVLAELLMRSVSKCEGLINKHGADAAAGAKAKQ